jgi:hypothetical protein
MVGIPLQIMGGYLIIWEKMIKAMLNKGRLYLKLAVFVVVFSCETQSIDDKELFVISEKGIVNYSNIYSSATDSITNWGKHDLANFNFERTGKKMILDSLICFDKKRKRFIGALLNFNFKNPNSDGIDYFYGEKIDGKWYFWTGAYIVIPRSIFPNNDPTKPLSYEQLHQMALEEIYGGYLKKNGDINEAWFDSHFEGGGWTKFEDRYQYHPNFGGRSINNKSDYFKYIHRNKALGIWIHERYVPPYTKKDFKFQYNKNSKELSIEINTYNPFPQKTHIISFLVHYKTPDMHLIQRTPNSGITSFPKTYPINSNPKIKLKIEKILENTKIEFYIELFYGSGSKSKRTEPIKFEIKNGVVQY